MDKPRPVLAITGTTASGKTALGIEIARRLDAEIISADSRQVYRRLDIGTAKPTAEELRAVPHHCIDICDPSEVYSAGRFFDDAVRLVADIRARGKEAIIVGGTGLYVQVLIDGLFDAPEVEMALRQALCRDAELHGLSALYKRLQALDPAGAELVPPRNPVRVLRALEICLQTGRPFSQVRTELLRKPEWEVQPWMLNWDRVELYGRINRRADHMIEHGLVDEVRGLIASGADPSWVAMRAVGYKEAVAYISSTCSLEEMREDIKRNTRRFAKRQLTWFRRMEMLNRVEAGPDIDSSRLAEHLMSVSGIQETG